MIDSRNRLLHFCLFFYSVKPSKGIFLLLLSTSEGAVASWLVRSSPDTGGGGGGGVEILLVASCYRNRR